MGVEERIKVDRQTDRQGLFLYDSFREPSMEAAT